MSARDPGWNVIELAIANGTDQATRIAAVQAVDSLAARVQELETALREASRDDRAKVAEATAKAIGKALVSQEPT